MHGRSAEWRHHKSDQITMKGDRSRSVVRGPGESRRQQPSSMTSKKRYLGNVSTRVALAKNNFVRCRSSFLF